MLNYEKNGQQKHAKRAEKLRCVFSHPRLNLSCNISDCCKLHKLILTPDWIELSGIHVKHRSHITCFEASLL